MTRGTEEESPTEDMTELISEVRRFLVFSVFNKINEIYIRPSRKAERAPREG